MDRTGKARASSGRPSRRHRRSDPTPSRCHDRRRSHSADRRGSGRRTNRAKRRPSRHLPMLRWSTYRSPSSPRSSDTRGRTPRGRTPRGRTPRGRTPRGRTPRGRTPRGRSRKRCFHGKGPSTPLRVQPTRQGSATNHTRPPGRPRRRRNHELVASLLQENHERGSAQGEEIRKRRRGCSLHHRGDPPRTRGQSRLGRAPAIRTLDRSCAPRADRVASRPPTLLGSGSRRRSAVRGRRPGETWASRSTA
jgi:hypothetical protein